MDAAKSLDAEPLESIERELRLVREAISLVAGGASQRVVLAGIEHGEELLDTGRRLALAAGVRMVRLSREIDGPADLAVERIRD
ncbi:MAG TPA: hypothetical protein VGJ71_01030 [Candidatus Limnocylindrales bacterium]|jgi:hypothetical protein